MEITAKQLTHALEELSRRGYPSTRVRKFLLAHYETAGRVATMTYLATKAGYKNYRGVNVQYGRLSKAVADELGIQPLATHLFLLTEFVEPDQQSNADWQIVMRPEFAKALESAGWL